jgi:hypothetical protein
VHRLGGSRAELPTVTRQTVTSESAAPVREMKRRGMTAQGGYPSLSCTRSRIVINSMLGVLGHDEASPAQFRPDPDVCPARDSEPFLRSVRRETHWHSRDPVRCSASVQARPRLLGRTPTRIRALAGGGGGHGWNLKRPRPRAGCVATRMAAPARQALRVVRRRLGP